MPDTTAVILFAAPFSRTWLNRLFQRHVSLNPLQLTVCDSDATNTYTAAFHLSPAKLLLFSHSIQPRALPCQWIHSDLSYTNTRTPPARSNVRWPKLSYRMKWLLHSPWPCAWSKRLSLTFCSCAFVRWAIVCEKRVTRVEEYGSEFTHAGHPVNELFFSHAGEGKGDGKINLRSQLSL